MHHQARNLIFLIFATVFVIGAPIIVFYTAGYRLNFNTWRVQQTGVIALSSLPKGANISLDGLPLNAKTPYVIQRLSPRDHTVTLQKDGYKSWSQKLSVNSGQTSYATVTLFADSKPELLLKQTAITANGEPNGRFIDLLINNKDGESPSLLRYDTVTQLSYPITSHDADLIAINSLTDYKFYNNDSQTELRTSLDHTLVTLLPLSTYSVIFTNKTITIFSDTRSHSYILNHQTNTVKPMNIKIKILALNDNQTMFVTSDGNEINTYDVNTGEVALITRQSDQIIALDWNSDQQTILCATSNKIFAIEQENYASRDATILLDNVNIQNMWLDTTGKRITFYGTVDGETGIWSLALTQ